MSQGTEHETRLRMPPASERPSPERLGPERIGPYRVVDTLGQGGMGVVHLCLDPKGRAVAVKVLRSHVAADPDARDRLGREVETLSRIRDGRVASVLDADIHGPRPYIVTRYVPGPSLEQVVAEHGPLPPAELLAVARGLAEAIRETHGCGVVHRDIKPANILLEDGQPVLIDFGIAHIEQDSRNTQAGLVMGTPGYLSPELVGGAPITDATDWWGWAATLTYAASGRPPFGGGAVEGVLARVRAGEVDLEGVDPRLQPLLRAALSPVPSERPLAAQVLRALEDWAEGRTTMSGAVAGARSGVWDSPRQHVGDPVPVDSWEPGPPPPPRWSPPRQPSGPAHRMGAGSATGQAPASREPHPGWGGGGAAYDAGAAGPVWDEADLVHTGSVPVRPGDPRVGKDDMSLPILLFALAWLGLFAFAPTGMAIILAVFCVLARTVERSITGLVVRRHDHGGPRRSDHWWAAGMLPVHLVVGLATSAVALLAAAAAAGIAGFATALLLRSGLAVEPAGAGMVPSLLVGGAVGLWTLWLGAGGAAMRRGTRSCFRVLGDAPHRVGQVRLAGWILLVIVAVMLLTQVINGSEPLWAPFADNPFRRG